MGTTNSFSASLRAFLRGAIRVEAFWICGTARAIHSTLQPPRFFPCRRDRGTEVFKGRSASEYMPMATTPFEPHVRSLSELALFGAQTLRCPNEAKLKKLT